MIVGYIIICPIVHVKLVSWIIKNACFIFLIARTSTLNIWHSFLWQWIHIFIGPKFDHCLALSILQSLTPLYDCETWLVKVVTWICQNWYMDFSKLLQGFVKVLLCFYHLITYKVSTCLVLGFPLPFAKQNQFEVWPRLQSLLELLLWLVQRCWLRQSTITKVSETVSTAGWSF